MSQASASYQLHQGDSPVDGATADSEQVLLAEHFSTSSSFALPRAASGNWLRVEVECSTKNDYRTKVFYGDGGMMANGSGTERAPNRPYVMEGGSDAALSPEQVQVIVDEKADMQLSIISYTSEGEK